MANPSNSTATEKAPPLTPMVVIVPAVAWVVPGAGHLILKRWGRGALLMASIVLMWAIGILLQGRVYGPNGGDLLEMLGFVGDLGAGALYIVSRALELGAVPISKATADYGKIFLIAAGLLNFMTVADAYHIAIGKKK